MLIYSDSDEKVVCLSCGSEWSVVPVDDRPAEAPVPKPSVTKPKTDDLPDKKDYIGQCSKCGNAVYNTNIAETRGTKIYCRDCVKKEPQTKEDRFIPKDMGR